MKVLVVEDEKQIASFIRKGLEMQDFMVDACHQGNEAFIAATTRSSMTQSFSISCFPVATG